MTSPQQPWSQPGPGGPPPSYGNPPQGYPAQQPGRGYGQAPQPAPAAFGGPTGELVLNLQKPFGAMGMINPVVTIDGYPASSQWGRNSFRVPVGVRKVDVAQTYLWTYGHASMPVTVEPGGSSEIYYAGPLATFGLGGAIGVGPQKRPGRAIFVGLMIFVAVVVVFAVLAGILGSS